jgi:hypothetical protein
MVPLALCALVYAASALGPAPSDELGLATLVAAAGAQAHVPVYVRDRAATLLNEGDGADNEIQSFAFQVMFAPTFVDASAFVHAGVTSGHNAFFSQVTPGADNLYVLKAFNEVSDALIFTLDAAAPGNLIGEVLITIDPATPDGTAIELTLQSFNAALIDASATESETVANLQLLLTHGRLIVGTQTLFANGFE